MFHSPPELLKALLALAGGPAWSGQDIQYMSKSPWGMGGPLVSSPGPLWVGGQEREEGLHW